MTEWYKYRDTSFLWCEIDEGKKMWRRELDNGAYYLVQYQSIFTFTQGIRYCVAYHGGSENYWEFTTHEAAMKRVRELVYGVEKKLGKE